MRIWRFFVSGTCDRHNIVNCSGLVEMGENEDTHLSVSGEEGRSTILLAHYILWFLVEDKVI